MKGLSHMKMCANIYIEQILEKIQACDNNPQESSQPKKANIQRVATHYSHTVYSMMAKAKMIFTEVLPV